MKVLLSEYIAMLLPPGATLKHRIEEQDGETIVFIYADIYGQGEMQPLELGGCSGCG